MGRAKTPDFDSVCCGGAGEAGEGDAITGAAGGGGARGGNTHLCGSTTWVLHFLAASS